MVSLVTGDIHLTLKPRDAYRWGIFPWMREQIQKHKIDEIILLGDVTEEKDEHTSVLVNRLCKELYSLSEHNHVIWLMGNHDCITIDSPFFGFLDNNLNITYVSESKVIDLSIGKATFIPAAMKWNFKLHDLPFVFTHATFSGAKAENGTTLTGVDPKVLDNYKGIVYSGDIHTPQKIGDKIVYVGAPYHVKFGDTFNPRLLVLTDKGEKDIHYPAPKKHVVDIQYPDELLEDEFEPGDQVKVRCYLRRSDYVEWKDFKTRIRSIAESNEWDLCGVELKPIDIRSRKEDAVVQKVSQPEDLIRAYIKQQKADKAFLDKGLELIS